MSSAADKVDLELLRTHEYDAQHFGFTIEDFMSAMKDLFEDQVRSHIQVLNSTLMKKRPENCTEEEVTKATNKLIELYTSKARGPFKELEEKLKDIFHIPENVLLPSDGTQRTQYSAQDEQEVNRQWSDLMNRIKRAKCFHTELRQELKILRQIVPMLTRRLLEFEIVQSEFRREDILIPELESTIDEEINKSLRLLKLKKEIVKN